MVLRAGIPPEATALPAAMVLRVLRRRVGTVRRAVMVRRGPAVTAPPDHLQESQSPGLRQPWRCMP